MIERSRKSFMNNLLVNNVALCVGRQGNVTGSDIYDIIYMSQNIVDLNLLSSKWRISFPTLLI